MTVSVAKADHNTEDLDGWIEKPIAIVISSAALDLLGGSTAENSVGTLNYVNIGGRLSMLGVRASGQPVGQQWRGYPRGVSMEQTGLVYKGCAETLQDQLSPELGAKTTNTMA